MRFGGTGVTSRADTDGAGGPEGEAQHATRIREALSDIKANTTNTWATYHLHAGSTGVSGIGHGTGIKSLTGHSTPLHTGEQQVMLRTFGKSVCRPARAAQ